MAHKLNKNFDEKQLKALRSKFSLYSSDNGRTIKKDDAIKVIRALGQNPSLKEFRMALNDPRINTDNVITFEEFQIIAMKLWSEEHMEFSLSEAFKRFDKSKNGSIDTKEFREAMLSYGEPLDQKEFEDLMRLADMDHDGKISYSEFIRLFTQVLDD